MEIHEQLDIILNAIIYADDQKDVFSSGNINTYLRREKGINISSKQIYLVAEKLIEDGYIRMDQHSTAYYLKFGAREFAVSGGYSRQNKESIQSKIDGKKQQRTNNRFARIAAIAMIMTIASIIFSVFQYFDSKSDRIDIHRLEKRIDKLEKKVAAPVKHEPAH